MNIVLTCPRSSAVRHSEVIGNSSTAFDDSSSVENDSS